MSDVNRGVESKPKGHRSPVDISSHREVILELLLFSNKYRMMSQAIKRKFGEDISPRALKHYREYRLKEGVKKVQEAQEHEKKKTAKEIAKIEGMKNKGLEIIKKVEKTRREQLGELEEHLAEVDVDIDKRMQMMRKLGDKARKDAEKTGEKLRILSYELKTQIERFREELSAEVNVAKSMNWVFNCTLKALEARLAMMQKVPVVSPHMIPELKMAMEILEKVRDEQISLGKHPRLPDSNMPRGMFVGGHQYFGQRQQFDQRRVKVIVNRETAKAGLKLLAAQAKLRKVEVEEVDEE